MLNVPFNLHSLPRTILCKSILRSQLQAKVVSLLFLKSESSSYTSYIIRSFRNRISQRLSPISLSKPRYIPHPIQLTYLILSSTRKRRPAKGTERGPGRWSRSSLKDGSGRYRELQGWVSLDEGSSTGGRGFSVPLWNASRNAAVDEKTCLSYTS